MTLEEILMLVDPIVILLTGAVIRKDAGGDKAKEAVRAQEMLGVVTAFQEIVGGNTAGLAGLQVALQSMTTDPSEIMALMSVLSILGTKAQALTAGSLLSTVNTAVMNSVANDVISVCKAYMAPAPGTPPLAS